MAYNISYIATIGGSRVLTNNNGTGYAIAEVITLPQQRTGTKVDRYRDKIRRRENASSNFSMTRNTLNFEVPFSALGHQVDSGGRDYGLVSLASGQGHLMQIGFSPNLMATSDKLEALALSDFISKVMDQLESFQSIPFVKEFHQTKGMIGTRAQTLYDSAFDLKRQLTSMYHKYRTLRRGWRSFIADAGNTYLEYKFGWAPLMHDIASAYNEIQNGLSNSKSHVSGKYKSDSVGGGYTINRYAGSAAWCENQSTYLDIVIRYTTTLRLSLNLPQRWGASAGSIPGAIWEVTPWSWLVDYFIDVQGFLNQWQVAAVPRVYLTKSVKSTAVTWRSASPRNTSGNRTSFALGSVVHNRVNYVRTALSDFPFYVPTVTLAGPFQGSREWNLIALGGTKFRPFR